MKFFIEQTDQQQSSPDVLRMIRGSVGKEFVVKHYGDKIVVTKFPAKSNRPPTAHQLKRRKLFLEAVEYAKAIIADPVKKAAWQKKIRRPNGVYNEAIKAYLRKDKLAQEESLYLSEQLLVRSFKDEEPRVEPRVVVAKKKAAAKAR